MNWKRRCRHRRFSWSTIYASTLPKESM